MHDIHVLIKRLQQETCIYIQTHNFPDHDAVSAAFGLQHLLTNFDITSRLIYEGDIQRESLANMIKSLRIDIRHNSEYQIKEEDLIIIVDGCKGNKNVTNLIGDEIAVIDHHQVVSPEDVHFSDIRSDYGACCSIIFSYYGALSVDMTQDVATALMIGINMDTLLLTRGVSPFDLDAYSKLYRLADILYVNSVLRNQVQTKDLTFFKYALDKVVIKNTFAFCYFPDGCNQNLLGILGDFFLSLQEVDFVALCALNNEKINFSLRSEEPQWDASTIIQRVLSDIGFGGGHVDRAGGMMPDATLFKENLIYQKFLRCLQL